jgi:hypothetical protein
MIEHNERPLSPACQNCSKELLTASVGRRRRFCSDACRKALKRGVSGQKSPSRYHPSGSEKSSNFLSRNQGLAMSGNEEFEPSRSLAHSSKQLTFQKLNSITWKVTDGVQINTGAGRASRALGYVVEVFPGRWMARVGNLGSDLLSFGAAKQQAIRLYRCRDKGTMDWIHELNLRAAAEINRTALASDKRKTPVDLIGGQRHGLIDPKISAAVLEAEVGFLTDARPETIKGDDYTIEYHSDGYPNLPVCIDRRRPRLRQAA